MRAGFGIEKQNIYENYRNMISRLYEELVVNRFENLTPPNFITFITLACALSGIYLLLNNNFLLAALLLWTVCDVFDTADGYIARRFNMFSPLGADLDSLVDVIAFLIPPFLISFRSGNNLLLVAAFIFVFAGIYRLARFNVEKKSTGTVVGLQVTLAAHFIYLSILIDVSSDYLAMIYITLSLLMISPKKLKGITSLRLTAALIVLNVLLIVLNMSGS